MLFTFCYVQLRDEEEMSFVCIQTIWQYNCQRKWLLLGPSTVRSRSWEGNVVLEHLTES